ncbi:MAG: heme NO-binding domain-containing protein [Deltaproteobacteria bacterium]|nr:heme NO-binding domain-containing protein [Deltaproteobacteria bacterium]
MKGEIFNLLELFVSEEFGDETFDAVLDDVEDQLTTKDPFVGPQTYPDSDFMIILGSLLSRLSLPMEPAVFQFGRFCFSRLAAKLPGHLESFSHPKPFLMSIDSVIHVEVRKLYRDAEPPRFSYEDTSPFELRMIYKSPRKMYALVEGLVQGAAEHYLRPIVVVRNVRESDCEFICTFDTPWGGPQTNGS